MIQNSKDNPLLKLNDALETVEVSKAQAEMLGAIEEDALTEQDAIESSEGITTDLIAT